MSRQSFWHLLPRAEKEREVSVVHQVKTWKQFDNLFIGAQIDDQLFTYIHDNSARENLRRTLLSGFFSHEARHNLQKRSDMTTEAWRYSDYLLQNLTASAADIVTSYKVRPAVRQQGFRRSVIHIYDNCCTQCGIRIRTPEGYSVIDAAHIIPWRISQNDSPVNGLALCKLCHWLFDTGLSAITSAYIVIISPQIKNAFNIPGHLLSLEGSSIFLPSSHDLRPSLSALEWHRKEIFQTSVG